MLLCLSVKPSKLHAILIQTQENDRYGMKGINTYQRSPKLEFLRGMDGRFMTSKPLVTARLHTLPIVPLSKPCVVSTKTSPIPRDDEQSNKENKSKTIDWTNYILLIGILIGKIFRKLFTRTNYGRSISVAWFLSYSACFNFDDEVSNVSPSKLVRASSNDVVQVKTINQKI